MPFFALTAALAVIAGLLCRLGSAVIPSPWPALLTTSATWGLLVWGVLSVAFRYAGRSRHAQSRLGFVLAGAGAMVVLLVTSGAWTAPLSIAAALVAGSLVGFCAERTSSGESAWLGVIGGLLMGEGAYGVILDVSPDHASIQYWTELMVGAAVALIPRQRVRSLVVALGIAVVIALGCLAYDSLR
ncbi:DUF6518 family protein [Parenemella sanctibonifatiensis]|uniref:Uncharacterized protein n=1 Tax=Parenemella sanctibonifatiensis TaxID=2016505 RepID=A0A255EMJ0_9ACTN|nr:DUF6518 family protein [Parenemella sanctibonifatiensis]OYN92726.1 hypothetical protein CGZ91_04485 [Parenemella sanctibonifatiensis]